MPSGDFLRERLTRGLDPEQLQAVTTARTPLCIVAPAGSGKTSVLTRRIAYRVVSGTTNASRVLAISFTRAAAFQLKVRTEALLEGEHITAGTFHSFALSGLKRHWDRNRLRHPRILNSKTSLVSEAYGRVLGEQETRDTGGSRPSSRSQSNLVNALAGQVEWYKARAILPHQLGNSPGAVSSHSGISDDLARIVYQTYEQLKSERNLVDMDDLVLLYTSILASSPTFAEEERFLYRHLYVDEFQDVNQAQMDLLLGLLGSRSDLTVVGDPDQSIYGWNGSDPTLMLTLPDRFPSMEVKSLATNYRSTPELLRSARAVLPRPANPRFGVSPSAYRASQAISVPRIVNAQNEEDEAKEVLRTVQRLHYQGVRFGQMAVLARVGASLSPTEIALSRANIPLRTPSSPSLFFRQGVAEYLIFLRRSGTNMSLTSLIDVFEASLVAPQSLGAAESPAAPAIELASLRVLISMASRLRREGQEYSALEFISLVEDGTLESVGETGAVTLTTFHRAKGLEWYHVSIVGCEDGFSPHYQATSPGALEEEQRLLYVAMTRATDSLSLSHTKTRKLSNRSVQRRPSPYLSRISIAPERLSTELSANGDSITNTLTRAKREMVARAPTPIAVPEVLHALQRWRTFAARRARTTPEAIASDGLIKLLARTRPQSQADLAAIKGSKQLRLDRHVEEILEILRL